MSSVEPELPEYYQLGASLSLNLGTTNNPLSLRVLRAFTPFTMAQAILVEHDPGKDSSANLHLPETFLLKVYDPKFYSHRLPQGSSPARPWTLEAEMTAAAERQEENLGRDPDFEPWSQPDDDDAPGWEEWYYQNAELQYHAEVSAYGRLEVLQSTTVVRCYGTGLLQVPQRAFAPHALLLEFIPDVKTLDQVDPKVVPPNLIHSLLETTKEFGKLGVVHTDLNPGNILFSPSDHPLRAVIIDFGESGVREDETDEEWQEIVDQNRDPVWMRKRLQQFLGDMMPHEQATCSS
ncbi:hypothetical protein M378DRAFT_166726 [Amanita muscaria Koide BX008]|uniref:ABC1 atypical kinase-like domain-containing protein n=1 Tax=Amanita muscaria (strain Koide BX008) TaxID=946122 RepID=A0A0C2WYX7_AMAMK|nr:hypothetical protein M378DRAFT_166726 [Amanita muscaria Koide BX008]